jgi:hypothetical protein
MKKKANKDAGAEKAPAKNQIENTDKQEAAMQYLNCHQNAAGLWSFRPGAFNLHLPKPCNTNLRCLQALRRS